MSDVIAGRIELLEPLARGASGSLWRAVDRRYGAVCAAKVMRQRDGAEVLRFVREQAVGGAQGLGAHPNLLPPYTWVAEDDTIVLVMPLVHGGTLASALADHGALSPSLVAHLLRQLLDALAAMHAQRWVHRDVKPANLLLDATGSAAPHLLLADFGIALHESDVRLTETGFVHGTPGFMAPEALEGAGTSAAQDVWAAGACAVEALDPRPPRERPDPSALPARIDSALAGSADPAAPVLGRLLHALLAKDPDRRPSAAEAREALAVMTAPPSHWSRTAAGAPVEIRDRIGSADGRPEVPLDGPGRLAGVAPGLHEQLMARSAGSAAGAPSAAPAPSPAAAPPRAPSPPAVLSPPAEQDVPDTADTERFVRTATLDAAVASPPASQPSYEPQPSHFQQPPASRERGRTAAGVVLLVLALAALVGAGVLVVAALT
ncbi:serine/threonine-protein kinase [Brachybacterium aquaticum]|uniref:non-specific serine/threonine protein kinase n=1 Tax=Brachybacterium aquaticum TaxID=1432564 RepID=A0A841AF25_9MICO|nr:serine/threonine-protein kinase [Brachybacterium aquaticum]MBB5831872.1 serine/threonine-protein kinase [Brachybacterium aquaticum]